MSDEPADLSGEANEPGDFSMPPVRPTPSPTNPGHDASMPPPPGPSWTPLGAEPHRPAAPAPSRRSRTPLIVGFVLLSIVALVGGCIAFIAVSAKGPIDETNRVVGLIDDGRFSEAAAAFDPACGGEVTADDVASFLPGTITGYRFTSASVSASTSNDTTGLVTGTIQIDGVDTTVVAVLVKRGDEWRMCSLDR